MTTKNLLIIAAIAGVGYYFYNKKQKEKANEAASEEASNINGAQYLEYERGQ
jgi:uncharacterized membrane protein YebE (DUF533 family)